jgi:D-alanyl-lipoteichoic acid acyltransferase DltB (MBOAT superfamily)
MHLDSALFFVFLGLLLVITRLAPIGSELGFLLVASMVFYALANPAYLALVLFLIAVNFFAMKELADYSETGKRHVVFWGAVSFDVGLLGFFKWASSAWSPALHLPTGIGAWVVSPMGTLVFPLGLSYLVFQMLSCLTDTYRRAFDGKGGVATFLLFGSFFPYVSAGPIPRASVLIPQLKAPGRASQAEIASAFSLILFGLFQKFVVANRLSLFVHQVYSTDLPLSSLPVGLGFVFSALQLYADFSGYTDIARGSALLFGIRLGENFDRPLLADSVTDFWRRWHISLSTWLRDYLYMPLLIRLRDLGNAGVFIAFLVTFAICGLWHRATWTWLLFGLLHGLALSIEFATRKSRKKWFSSLPGLQMILGRTYTLGFYVLTNALVPSKDIHQALSMYGRLLSFSLPHSPGELFAYQGPLLFLLNFVALGSWWLLARIRNREGAPARFNFVCAVLLVLLGKLPEGNFIYVQF